MKVTEVLSTKYQIYQDLDGCLVNFDKFAEDHMGISPYDWDTNKSLKKEFWKKVSQHVASGKRFFGDMEKMPDADELWNFIKPFDPIILSATGHVKTADKEKREWIAKHLGQRYADTALLVTKSADKAQYANPKSILIDDREKSIKPWVEAGGIGILHISAEDTIEQLKQFLDN